MVEHERSAAQEALAHLGTVAPDDVTITLVLR
jgi:hypothetical protein